MFKTVHANQQIRRPWHCGIAAKYSVRPAGMLSRRHYCGFPHVDQWCTIAVCAKRIVDVLQDKYETLHYSTA